MDGVTVRLASAFAIRQNQPRTSHPSTLATAERADNPARVGALYFFLDYPSRAWTSSRSLYRDHIAAVKKRHDRALAATGYDARHHLRRRAAHPFSRRQQLSVQSEPALQVVGAGRRQPALLRRLHAGAKPKLVFYQPVDYWYKPADDAERMVDRSVRDLCHHRSRTGEAALPDDGTRRVHRRVDERSVRAEPSNPAPLLSRLRFDRAWKTDYEIECIRRANVSGARGHRAAEKAFRDGQSEFEIHLAYLRATRCDRGGAAVRQHHRAQRARLRLCTTRCTSAQRPDERRYSFLIDAGAQSQRLRLRHHAHVLARERRVPGAHRGDGCNRSRRSAPQP